MSMQNQESPRIAATLAHRVGQSANSTQIADAVAHIWSEAECALIPIIGKQGVVALMKRSLFLSSPAHIWLANMHQGVQTSMDLATLKSQIAQQTADEALAGSETLLLRFYEVLTSLIGPSLADRLLDPVWANPSSGETAQDRPL
jgi:hypothetical protein